MANLIIMHDQTGATGKDIIALPDGINPIDALMMHFPQGLNPDATQVFIGTEPLLQDDPKSLEPLTETLVVVMEAKGTETLIYLVVALVLAVALAPSIPGDVGQTKNSPNNDLQGQTNIARPYQAYPLIFGSPVSFPDLTGEPVVEYISNQKFVRQLMVVGQGLFDNPEVRTGATPVTNFTGGSATYYTPVNDVVTVPEEINVFATNEVDGQELVGTNNDVTLKEYLIAEEDSFTITQIETIFTFAIEKDAVSDGLKIDYDLEPIDFKLKLEYRTTTDIQEFNKISSGLVQSIELDVTNTFYIIVLTEFDGLSGDPGGYSIIDTTPIRRVENSIVGPIKIEVETDEIWVNLNFLRGLKSTARINIRLTRLDGFNGEPIPGPTPDFYQREYTADTLEQKFYTEKFPLISPKGYFQVTVERLDVGTNDAARPDQLTIEAIYAVSRAYNVVHGNLTMLDVIMPATINATSLRENKVNLTPTSKLITYENGAVNYTPQPSRKMADAILHLTVISLGRSPDTLALDELYEIQDRLDAINPELAQFDFTFDDIDVSYEEKMDAILQVARCYKFQDGNVYRFGRNEERSSPATSLTNRDIARDREYSLTYSPQLQSNFDGIKVEYVDRDTNKKAYIFRKMDDNGDIVEGASENPNSIELAGCQSEYNAINRAELEIRTLIYQRFSLTDTILPSGMFLDKGDMLLYAEQYNTNAFDGEIYAVNGNIATTSGELDFVDGQDYMLNYTTIDGSNVGPFPIFAVTGNKKQFSCNDLGSVFVRDSILGNEIQTGSRYFISTTETMEQSKWSVLEKEVRGDNIQLTMAQYDERIYEYDEV